jgi:hypothetical protein
MFPWRKHASANSHHRKLREKLESIPMSKPPHPWKVVFNSTIGGLLAVGFAESSDDLLVVSSQGRGLFDCLSGNRIARDDADSYENADSTEMTVPGIGKHEKCAIPVAGIHGGGLATGSKDGWSIEVVQLPWPIHVVFLTSGFKHFLDASAQVTKIFTDEPCEYRAAGFSPTGKSFVIATSGELTIYSRVEA